MKKSTLIPTFAAIGAAWLFLSGFLSILPGIRIFSPSAPGPALLLTLALFFLAGFVLALAGAKSVRVSLLAGLLVLLSLPVSYFLVAPLATRAILAVFPNYALELSGSFTGLWFLPLPVTLVALLAYRAYRPSRRLGLALGLAASLLACIAVEYATAHLGQNDTRTLTRLFFYAPFVWGLVVHLILRFAVHQHKIRSTS